MIRPRSLVAMLASAAALSLAPPGCSDYAEGDRCDANNGDDDCAAGLKCTKVAQTNGNNSDLCCPADGVATVPACVPGTGGGGAGGTGGTGGTAGTGGTGGTAGAGGSAGADAGSDAADDVTSDAAADAADDTVSVDAADDSDAAVDAATE